MESGFAIAHCGGELRQDHCVFCGHAADHASSGEARADDKHKMTLTEATLNFVNLVMNYSVFTLPVVYARSGMSTCLIQIGVAGVSLYTARMLGQVMEELRRSGVAKPTYGDAAELAVGPFFATVMHASQMLELIVYGVGNLIVLLKTFETLLPTVEPLHILICCSLVGLLLSAVPDKAYSYVSLISCCSVTVASVVVLMAGWELPAWAMDVKLVGPLVELPSSVCMVLFMVACHPVMPWIFNSVETYEDYQRTMRNGYVAWTVMGTVFGAVACVMFGDSIRVIATQNIGLDLQGRPLRAAAGMVGFSAAWVVLKMQTALVPISRPTMEAVAELLGVDLPSGNGGIKCMLLSIPTFAGNALLAHLLADSMRMLNTITGGVLMSLNAFIFPGIAYLVICEPSGLVSKAGGVVAIAGGFALSATMMVSVLA